MSFEFLCDRPYEFMLTPEVTGVISRIDNIIARMWFKHKDTNKQVDVPAGYFLVQTGSNKKTPSRNMEFYMAWHSNYVLYGPDKQVFMHIDAKRGYNCYIPSSS